MPEYQIFDEILVPIHLEIAILVDTLACKFSSDGWFGPKFASAFHPHLTNVLSFLSKTKLYQSTISIPQSVLVNLKKSCSLSHDGLHCQQVSPWGATIMITPSSKEKCPVLRKIKSRLIILKLGKEVYPFTQFNSIRKKFLN